VKTRKDQLIDLLQERGEVAVEHLVSLLEVSEATVRRDLAELQDSGLVVRTFGGARLAAEPSLIASTFNARREARRAEKERIARAAAELVQAGMSVAFDSGTTVWRVAAALKAKSPLTVLTSALAAIEELGPVPGNTVHCSGGRFRLANLDFTGTRAIAAFGGFTAQVAFVGTDRYRPGQGFFANDEESAALCAAIAGCAERVVVVMDHSKLDATAPHLALRCDEVDTLVVDSGLSPAQRSRLSAEPFAHLIA
jgi:DeoR/GlpR family transcriptional regulator of sugar metabolism